MSLTENTFSIWNDIVDFQMLKEVFVSVDIQIAKAFVHIGNVIYQWVNNKRIISRVFVSRESVNIADASICE